MNRRERRAQGKLSVVKGGMEGRNGNPAHIRTFDALCNWIRLQHVKEPTLGKVDFAGLLLRAAAMVASSAPEANAEEFGSAAEEFFRRESAAARDTDPAPA